MEELCLRAADGMRCCRSCLSSTFNYKHRSARVCSSRLLLTVGDMLRTTSVIKTGTLSVSSITGPNIASRQECQSKNLSLHSPLTSHLISYSHDGAGQQCCYDLDGYLMMTSDNKWGGKPMRSHNLGVLPWNEAAKIPTLSHWLQDVSPFYPCCVWQSEQSGGCQTYRWSRIFQS